MPKVRRPEAKVYVSQEDANAAIADIPSIRLFVISGEQDLEYKYVAAQSNAQALAIYAEEVLGLTAHVAVRRKRSRKSKGVPAETVSETVATIEMPIPELPQ